MSAATVEADVLQCFLGAHIGVYVSLSRQALRPTCLLFGLV